jgi:mannose/fructose/N-acetylgalactosamine-specific phosphotransferase system component IIC
VDVDYEPLNDIPIPLFSIVPILPGSLLSIAVILNLNNWTFYYFKIGEMASHIDQRAIKYGDYEKLKRQRYTLNFVTFIAIFTIVGFVIAISFKTIYHNTL